MPKLKISKLHYVIITYYTAFIFLYISHWFCRFYFVIQHEYNRLPQKQFDIGNCNKYVLLKHGYDTNIVLLELFIKTADGRSWFHAKYKKKPQTTARISVERGNRVEKHFVNNRWPRQRRETITNNSIIINNTTTINKQRYLYRSHVSQLSPFVATHNRCQPQVGSGFCGGKKPEWCIDKPFFERNLYLKGWTRGWRTNTLFTSEYATPYTEIMYFSENTYSSSLLKTIYKTFVKSPFLKKANICSESHSNVTFDLSTLYFSFTIRYLENEIIIHKYLNVCGIIGSVHLCAS